MCWDSKRHLWRLLLFLLSFLKVFAIWVFWKNVPFGLILIFWCWVSVNLFFLFRLHVWITNWNGFWKPSFYCSCETFFVFMLWKFLLFFIVLFWCFVSGVFRLSAHFFVLFCFVLWIITLKKKDLWSTRFMFLHVSYVKVLLLLLF